MIESDSSHVRRKKSGELWSSKHKDLKVKLYSPKAPFWKTIFRPLRGAAPPKFLRALENDQVLLAHSHQERGLSYNYFQIEVQNWLKINLSAPVTYAVEEARALNIAT